MITRSRLPFERDYVQIPNAWLRDGRLSLRARGLLAQMMTHKVGWRITVESLVEDNPEGRDAIRVALNELIGFGYLARESTTSGGRFAGVDYILCEPTPPETDSQGTVDEAPENAPEPENPTLIIRTEEAPPEPEKPAPENPQQRTLVSKNTISTTDVVEMSPLWKSAVIVDLCNLLADWIERNGSRRPQVTEAWLKSCDRMIRIDGIEPVSIRACIEWSQRSEFWQSNILSMPKLREKYAQMNLQARNSGKAEGSTTHKRVRAAYDIAEQLEAQGR